MKKDCTTCKYGYEDEQLGIPMCHHPKRFSEDCVDFNMHEEKETETEHRGSSEIPKDLDFEQELYKHFGQVKDFTLGMRIGKYFYELGKQSGNSEIPNDLEEASQEYEKKHTNQRYDGGGFTPEYDATLAEAVIFGAKWQAERDTRDMYMSDNRHFEKVYQLGRTDMREQMVKEADQVRRSGGQSKEQPACENLKKRASEIYPNKEGDLCSLHSTLQRGGYIRGYQDCKEQMMKEAVEGVVSLQFADGTGAVRTTDGFVLNGLRCGQKVRIIIVKEEKNGAERA